MARTLERSEGGFAFFVRVAVQAQVNKNAILAVFVWSPKGFALKRDQCFAVFAGGLCNELLRPRAKIGNLL